MKVRNEPLKGSQGFRCRLQPTPESFRIHLRYAWKLGFARPLHHPSLLLSPGDRCSHLFHLLSFPTVLANRIFSAFVDHSAQEYLIRISQHPFQILPIIFSPIALHVKHAVAVLGMENIKVFIILPRLGEDSSSQLWQVKSSVSDSVLQSRGRSPD